MTAEQLRLEAARQQSVPWKKWGPYLSERQWGTVREDYSEGGDAWNYFSHDQARSRGAMHLFATFKPETVLEGGRKAYFEQRPNTRLKMMGESPPRRRGLCPPIPDFSSLFRR